VGRAANTYFPSNLTLAVRNALADKYEIIVKEDNSEYEPDPGISPEEAKRFIKRAREQ
jgi:hypothetical protein